MQVRQKTEELRSQRLEIETPLNQLNSKMTQIKGDIDSKNNEIENIVTRADKLEVELQSTNS